MLLFPWDDQCLSKLSVYALVVQALDYPTIHLHIVQNNTIQFSILFLGGQSFYKTGDIPKGSSLSTRSPELPLNTMHGSTHLTRRRSGIMLNESRQLVWTWHSLDGKASLGWSFFHLYGTCTLMYEFTVEYYGWAFITLCIFLGHICYVRTFIPINWA